MADKGGIAGGVERWRGRRDSIESAPLSGGGVELEAAHLVACGVAEARRLACSGLERLGGRTGRNGPLSVTEGEGWLGLDCRTQ